MANGVTPTGFVDFDTVLSLVRSETRKDPKIDISFLMRNHNYIDTKHNLTVPLLKRDETGKIVSDGHLWVEIETEAQKWVLKEAIANKYQELSGKTLKLEEMGLRRITAAVDEQKNADGRPTINHESTTKFDDMIAQDTRIVEE